MSPRPQLPFGGGDPPRYTRDRHLEYVDEIRANGVNLTKWEEDFVVDLADRLERGIRLTTRQEQILDRIYAERTP